MSYSIEHPIVKLLEKKERLVIGLMSGTSADGMDAALCKISGFGAESKIEQLGFYFLPYETEVREELLRLASGKSASAADFCRMNFLVGRLQSEAALGLCAQMKLKPQDIDLIGCHGHTFWHIPKEEEYLGQSFKSTLQLGEAAVLAETFGCPVIGDFRVRDVAADGQGAPLVPYSEFLIYRSRTECVALQNIGGIGNITCLPPDCSLEDVFAFDTGPGNMLMDAVYGIITDGALRYDDGGRFAAKGSIHNGLLDYMMQDPYLKKQLPKTTGREYYGTSYVEGIMKYAREHSVTNEDLMATVTDFTAECIASGIHSFFKLKPDKLIVGGGGSCNLTLIEDLKRVLPDTKVVTNEEIGFDSNAKEAVAFAVLANEALFASANNVPSVTGAKTPVVMGKISL